MSFLAGQTDPLYGVDISNAQPGGDSGTDLGGWGEVIANGIDPTTLISILSSQPGGSLPPGFNPNDPSTWGPVFTSTATAYPGGAGFPSTSPPITGGVTTTGGPTPPTPVTTTATGLNTTVPLSPIRGGTISNTGTNTSPFNYTGGVVPGGVFTSGGGGNDSAPVLQTATAQGPTYIGTPVTTGSISTYGPPQPTVPTVTGISYTGNPTTPPPAQPVTSTSSTPNPGVNFGGFNLPSLGGSYPRLGPQGADVNALPGQNQQLQNLMLNLLQAHFNGG